VRRRLVPLLLALLAYASAATAVTPAEEETTIARWRAERAVELTGESGWLSLVGLYWLEPGVNTVGSDAANAIALADPQLDRHAGRFLVDARGVRFEGARGGCLNVAGSGARVATMRPDTSGDPTVLECGSLRFMVIERAGRHGVRVRDTASAARRAFKGVESFPVDASWVVDARFEPYDPVHHVTIMNVLGMELDMVAPGALVFERDGREWRLDALYEEPDAKQLFVMFRDGTSGHETYGAGRFINAPLPVDGHVALDFNIAHNPPCAFTTFATCPLPPPQNRIELRVLAGERRYDGAGH
jgi:hypothetical protein